MNITASELMMFFGFALTITALTAMGTGNKFKGEVEYSRRKLKHKIDVKKDNKKEQ